MRILLGADFHLGARQNWLGGQAAARREDLNRAFTRFVDFALKPDSAVDLVLLLGDLFDHHAPTATLVDLARRQLERLTTAGLPVAAIPGTHDGFGYADSVYRTTPWPAGLTLITSPALSRTTIEVQGAPVNLYGLAYDPGRTPADPLQGLKRDPSAPAGLHIAMIHGSLPASPEWDYRRRDLPVPTADLPLSGLDLVALGHYHNFMERWFGDTLALYPGTLEGLKWSESGERAFVVVQVGEGNVRVERVPFPGRRIQDDALDIGRLGDPADGLARRLEEMAGLDRIVRLRLTGAAQPGFSADSLRARFAEKFFHLDIDDRTLSVDERWRQRIADERTVRGLFVRRMKERMAAAPEDEQALVATALRLGLTEFAALEVPDEN